MQAYADTYSHHAIANTGGTAEQYNHYYPLGGPITQYSTSASLQPLKFQGKEWDDAKGFNVYDFGARRYDPATVYNQKQQGLLRALPPGMPEAFSVPGRRSLGPHFAMSGA